MASRKEYEMLFRLNAQIGSSYNATFSKAQSEFGRLGNEIQSLNKVQSDISSYQKQQNAITSTSAKLESLQRQHDLLQKEISETSGSTTALEREEEKLAQKIRDTEASLERQQNKLEATNSRLQEAGINTADLTNESARLGAQIKDLSAKQEEAANSAEDFGETSSEAFEAASQAIVAAGIASALHEIAEAYMVCVNIAGEFESAMSTVAALSGATAGEMEQLTAKAKELGATTVYTAKDAADAMGYMGMAGWDASQMLAGMDGVLQLAAASGEDLAMVSDIVTDNLTAFGLKASDTARFADVLAATATGSNTSVSIMGETFKQSAAIAGALGYSIEDVSVAVGLMANAGIKGSIAGTALKNTFNGLLEGATFTGEALGEYEFTALKADGTMKSFADTINELRGVFSQLSEAEKVNNAMALAGQRGYNGLLAVINTTDEDYASLTASINDCTGAAAKMSAIKLDNLNGELALMQSAWDALKTTIGEQFIPEMRELYSVGADVFSGADEFIQKNPALVKSLAVLVAGIGGVTTALTAYAAISKVIKALNVASMFAGPAGPVLALGVGVAALAAEVVLVAQAMDEATVSVDELTEAAHEMERVMAEAGSTFEDTMMSTEATASMADTYISKLEELEAAGLDNDDAAKEYHNTLALLCQAVPELSEHINLQTNEIEGGTKALREHTEAWKENARQQAYQAYLNSLYENYNNVMAEIAENEIKRTQAMIDQENAQKGMATAYENFLNVLGMTDEEFKKTWGTIGKYQAAGNGLRGELRAAIKDYNGFWVANEEAADAIEALDQAIELGNAALVEAEGVINTAQESLDSLTSAEKAEAEAAALAAAQQEELVNTIASVEEQTLALAEAYTLTYNSAYESITGQKELWDEAAEVSKTSIDDMNKNLHDQAQYWADYNANLESLTARTGEIEGLREVIASFADGSEDSVNAVAGMATATDDDLREMVKNWQDLKKEQEEASGSIAELKTNFSVQMDELQTIMAEDVEALSLGKEAAQSARETLQGFIDGAKEMEPEVQAAFNQIAAAAHYALIKKGIGFSLNYNIPGYASGTDNAAPGWALVGENGPELAYFGGGEKVIPAAQTAAMLGGSSDVSIKISLAPSYRFEGGTPNAEQIQEVLDRNNASLREMVQDVIQDVVYERARRSYT